MNVTQIAITGSQGKTAVSQGLYAMLSTLRPTVVTDVNLDTIYNVPITTLKTRPYHHYAIFELGIDRLDEMDFHLNIVRPDIGVVTGVSPVHSDEAHMKSFDNVKKEKRKLIEALTDKGIAILNYSDQNVRAMATHTKAKVIWYGRDEDFIMRQLDVKSLSRAPSREDPENNNYHWMPASSGMTERAEVMPLADFVLYSNIKVTTEGTEFDLHDHLLTLNICHPACPDIIGELVSGSAKSVNSKTLHIKTRLIGTFHAANICAIYCILKTLNPYFVENFDSGVYELLSPLPGRMNIEKGPIDSIVLNDSLRANPTSTTAGLETFVNIDYKKGRKVVIMADMGELEKPEDEHRKIGRLIAALPIQVIVCAGKMQKFVAIEAAKNKKCEVHYYDTVADAKNEILQILRPKDFIYLKGSLYSRVGEILK